MGKFKLEVTIPDGKYCSGGLANPEVNCNYVGDSCASSAGLCALLESEDRLLRYEDETYWRILKHRNCPGQIRFGDL